MPRVTFLPDSVAVDVPPGTSILEAAARARATVGHACGGEGACSTCHVYVTNGQGSLSDAEDREQDALDKAFDVRSSSRLACQARVGSADVTVEVTRESRAAYLAEHPDEEHAGEAGDPSAR
jgi:ferredoxin, 2Fe-2S